MGFGSEVMIFCQTGMVFYCNSSEKSSVCRAHDHPREVLVDERAQQIAGLGARDGADVDGRGVLNHGVGVAQQRADVAVGALRRVAEAMTTRSVSGSSMGFGLWWGLRRGLARGAAA